MHAFSGPKLCMEWNFSDKNVLMSRERVWKNKVRVLADYHEGSCCSSDFCQKDSLSFYSKSQPAVAPAHMYWNPKQCKYEFKATASAMMCVDGPKSNPPTKWGMFWNPEMCNWEKIGTIADGNIATTCPEAPANHPSAHAFNARQKEF